VLLPETGLVHLTSFGSHSSHSADFRLLSPPPRSQSSFQPHPIHESIGQHLLANLSQPHSHTPLVQLCRASTPLAKPEATYMATTTKSSTTAMAITIFTDPSTTLKSWLCTKTAKAEYVTLTSMNGRATRTTSTRRSSLLSTWAMLVVDTCTPPPEVGSPLVPPTMLRISPSVISSWTMRKHLTPRKDRERLLIERRCAMVSHEGQGNRDLKTHSLDNSPSVASSKGETPTESRMIVALIKLEDWSW